jgi:hypothetical protein
MSTDFLGSPPVVIGPVEGRGGEDAMTASPLGFSGAGPTESISGEISTSYGLGKRVSNEELQHWPYL